MKPLNDYIFLKYDKKEEQKEGIILSDIMKDLPSTAEVFAVGDEVKKVKKGDTVIFNPFVAREIKVEKEKYLLIKEKEVYGKNN